MSEQSKPDEDKILFEINGQWVYIVDGWDLRNGLPEVVKYGILETDIRKRSERGQSDELIRFFMLVTTGLIMAKHVFSGLKRNLFCDNCMEGDRQKYIHSWKPKKDYEINPEGFGPYGNKVKEFDAPNNRVFVVITSKNKNHINQFPIINGWIEQWNWVEEDAVLDGAPLKWADRYEEKIFSREEEKL
ncbi:hypothetical protein [Candidatus Magnetominusculus xianensis]|uniref:Uncharacterized protein n=1 Tax=Candidatus Magnetominusculus xianensis TaxID=1748249 RepID=A0ABR5SDG8_9BACT|nr:hypothetical protein [Candidatus Magnetominusculus xianensis]KWT82958.1 hypothetical protein ASN18_2319 [Candidatus Magnetominusculus xianensis]MBF0403037.1 hypothetical protein [Nitrospirota bacterium]